MWSKLGIGALFISILLLGYNVLIAIMRMGHTDRFLFVPTNLMKTLGAENFMWINCAHDSKHAIILFDILS